MWVTCCQDLLSGKAELSLSELSPFPVKSLTEHVWVLVDPGVTIVQKSTACSHKMLSIGWAILNKLEWMTYVYFIMSYLCSYIFDFLLLSWMFSFRLIFNWVLVFYNVYFSFVNVFLYGMNPCLSVSRIHVCTINIIVFYSLPRSFSFYLDYLL